MSTIDAQSLVSAIRDVLLRMNTKVADCRGQCYDGASNMSGARKGVAAIITREESRAVYTHCYGHALNLAVADTVKQSKVCRDALDTAFEITRLIKFSPKRNEAFDQIKSRSEENSCPSPIGIRTFCHTRWTVRGDAIESILVMLLVYFGRNAFSHQHGLILTLRLESLEYDHRCQLSIFCSA